MLCNGVEFNVHKLSGLFAYAGRLGLDGLRANGIKEADGGR